MLAGVGMMEMTCLWKKELMRLDRDSQHRVVELLVSFSDFSLISAQIESATAATRSATVFPKCEHRDPIPFSFIAVFDSGSWEPYSPQPAHDKLTMMHPANWRSSDFEGIGYKLLTLLLESSWKTLLLESSWMKLRHRVQAPNSVVGIVMDEIELWWVQGFVISNRGYKCVMAYFGGVVVTHTHAYYKRFNLMLTHV